MTATGMWGHHHPGPGPAAGRGPLAASSSFPAELGQSGPERGACIQVDVENPDKSPDKGDYIEASLHPPGWPVCVQLPLYLSTSLISPSWSLGDLVIPPPLLILPQNMQHLPSTPSPSPHSDLLSFPEPPTSQMGSIHFSSSSAPSSRVTQPSMSDHQLSGDTCACIRA